MDIELLMFCNVVPNPIKENERKKLLRLGTLLRNEKACSFVISVRCPVVWSGKEENVLPSSESRYNLECLGQFSRFVSREQ